MATSENSNTSSVHTWPDHYNVYGTYNAYEPSGMSDYVYVVLYEVYSQDTLAKFCLYLVLLLGLVGNLVIILLVVFIRELHTISNVLLVNLASVDCLYVITTVPIFLTIVIDGGSPSINHEWFFYFFSYCPVLVFIVAVLTLVSISAERYLAIVKPLVRRRMDIRKWTVGALSCSWLVATVTVVILISLTVCGSSYCILPRLYVGRYTILFLSLLWLLSTDFALIHCS